MKKIVKIIFISIFITIGIIFITDFFNRIFFNNSQVVNSNIDIQNSVKNNSNHISNIISENNNIDKDTPWYLILANPWHKLPEDFSVKTVELKNGHSIDERAYNDLQNMMNDAKNEGLSPIICSSYRTVKYQIDLYNNQIEEYIQQGYTKEEAKEMTENWIAVPGTSEHHTGLALDIVSLDYQILDEKQEDTPEQQWLLKNSYKYGFILRYPKDKTDITGISYEPWHYRYVGKEAAKEIFEQKICLEEYLEQINN